MESNLSSTDHNSISRLGEVDPEECDALADVFLGTAAASVTNPDEYDGYDAEPAPRPRVLQLVVAGHLARAGALFSRFCESESLNPDRAIGCISHVGAGWSARLIGLGHRFNGRRATVAHAIGQVSATADRVNILLPPYREVGQLIEGLEGLSDPPDHIVILSTADESDVVAAYRQIKSIAAFCREQIDRTRVVLIDEPGEAADAALRRLVDTAARFLDTRISAIVIPEDEYDRAPESQSSEPDPASPVGDSAEPVPPLVCEPPRVDPMTVQPSEPPSSATGPIRTEQAEPVRAPDPLESETRSLLATLTWNMRVLGFRCPAAPQVVYAADGDGRIHAIASAADTGDLEAQPDPLASLARARAFIARHMPVLEPLDSRIRAAAGPPVAHLVSEHFADLAPCLDTDIRLHLAVPVRSGATVIWGVSELRAD